MKSNFKFNKAFLPCAILSLIIIITGVVGIFVRGINFSIDFVPGLVEEVRIAPAAVELTYSGSASVNVELDSTSISLVISGAGADNETKTFTFGQNPTVALMASALASVPGVDAKILNSADVDSYGLFANSMVTARLSSTPYKLYVASADSASIDDVRSTVESLGVSVKELGTAENRSFQIRSKLDKNSEEDSQALQEKILSALQAKFGADNVPVIRQDFVGANWSSSLLWRSIILSVLTIFLIWLYATIRFHWDFALGAVIALLHDCLIMFTFISWFQIEFSTTTLAAVLTIFGYSINATVVILDRMRENIKLMQAKNFTEIVNKSLNDTLTRSIITTVTTMFASISLWVFTSGAIETFAIVLTIGLVSGCYSSIFISTGFINRMRRNWQSGEWANHVRPHTEKKEKAETKISDRKD
ncbi:MAG: protein translocase subunit SecF [Treponema sp.]|nr:protein translocase subunit SecF [Treponema sp.]